MAERERQYRLSRENIDAINIKCHGLRHQIRQLAGGGTAVASEALNDIAREADVYDSAVHTGSEALDTILMEEHYGGALSTRAEDGIFNVNALFPTE